MTETGEKWNRPFPVGPAQGSEWGLPGGTVPGYFRATSVSAIVVTRHTRYPCCTWLGKVFASAFVPDDAAAACSSRPLSSVLTTCEDARLWKRFVDRTV